MTRLRKPPRIEYVPPSEQIVYKPDKGLKNGSCNVTSCQQPGAIYFNKSTRKYYCKRCADAINWVGGRKDTTELYGVPLLCELDEESQNEDTD